jgi:hypothetical protein
VTPLGSGGGIEQQRRDEHEHQERDHRPDDGATDHRVAPFICAFGATGRRVGAGAAIAGASARRAASSPTRR